MLLEDGSSLVYNVDFDEPGVGYQQNIPQQDMIHFRLLSRNGGKTGISPLSALLNEAEIQNQSNNLTLSAFKTGDFKSGSVIYPARWAAKWQRKSVPVTVVYEAN